MANKKKKNNSIERIHDHKQSLIAATQIERTEYSGPLPPAEEFGKYGLYHPDAPERILREFEENSKHIRKTEDIETKAEIARETRSQWMAFIIICIALGLVGFSLYLDKPIAAALSGLATIFLVFQNVFINNKK